jgi:hypothetical protein
MTENGSEEALLVRAEPTPAKSSSEEEHGEPC